MEKQSRKIVLAPKGFEKTSLGTILLSSGYEFAALFRSEDKEFYEFIVDEYLPEIKDLPRVTTVFKPNPSINDRAYINNKSVSKTAEKLLQNYFTDKNDLDLVDRYSKDHKDIFTIKIQDYINHGSFIDLIIVEAYKAKFDIVLMRNYLNHTLEYLFKSIEKKKSLLPVEVSFSFCEDVFAVAMCTPLKKFKLNEDVINDSKFQNEFVNNCNFVDFTYVERTEKLTVTSLWFKEKSDFHAYFFTHVTKRVFAEKILTNVQVAQFDEVTKYQPPEQEVIDNQSVLSIARRLAIHIKNRHKAEPEYINEITIEKVVEDSKTYPIRSEIDNASEDVFNKALAMLQEDDENFLNVVKGSAEEKELLTNISGTPDEKELVQKISGIKEESDDFKTIISANDERIEADDSLQSFANEKVDKSNLELKTIDNSLEMQVADLEAKLKLSEAKFNRMLDQNTRFKTILEQIKTEHVKLKSSYDLLKNNMAQIESDASFDSSVDIGTFKTVQGELAALKLKEKSFNHSKNNFDQLLLAKDIKISQLEQRLESTKKEFANSDEVANLDKLKKLAEENKLLGSKLELVTKKLQNTSNNTATKENEQLIKREKEIENFKVQLQMAHTLISKFKSEKAEIETKLSIETEKFKRASKELETPVLGTAPLVENTIKKAANVSSDKNSDKASDDKLASITSERNFLDEKVREQSIELKKLEHKLKMTSAQLDEANKKNNKSEKGSPGTNETYIRQVELVNKKLTEANNELSEKKKEALKAKQENNQLSLKVKELERKLLSNGKKAA